MEFSHRVYLLEKERRKGKGERRGERRRKERSESGFCWDGWAVLRLRAREARGWLGDRGDVEGVDVSVQAKEASPRAGSTRRHVLWQVFRSVSLKTLARCASEVQMKSSNDGMARSRHICESLEGCGDVGEHEASPKALEQMTDSGSICTLYLPCQEWPFRAEYCLIIHAIQKTLPLNSGTSSANRRQRLISPRILKIGAL